MGLKHQFQANHFRRHRVYGGSGLFSWAAKKFRGSARKIKETALAEAKKYAQDTLKPLGREIIDSSKDKLVKGAKDIIKGAAGNLTDSIMQDPSAASSILRENFANAGKKTKELIRSTVADSVNKVSDNKDSLKGNAGMALSTILNTGKAAVASDLGMGGSGVKRRTKEARGVNLMQIDPVAYEQVFTGSGNRKPRKSTSSAAVKDIAAQLNVVNLNRKLQKLGQEGSGSLYVMGSPYRGNGIRYME